MFFYKILNMVIAFLQGDLGTALITIIFLDFFQVSFDQFQDALGFSQNILIIGNLGYHIALLILLLGPFQTGQLREAHVQNSVGLPLR